MHEYAVIDVEKNTLLQTFATEYDGLKFLNMMISDGSFQTLWLTKLIAHTKSTMSVETIKHN